ncbi:hypothetical protein RF650_09535 [Kocuria sp. CPCC 205297]
MAALSGASFNRVVLPLAISPHIHKRMEAYCGAIVDAPIAKSLRSDYQNGDHTVLSFSGGLDSLSVRALMADRKIDLVSIDFGGRFRRERKFFQQFETTIVETDIVSSNLRAHGHDFMLVPALLRARAIGASGIATGQILESSAHSLLDFLGVAEESSNDAGFDLLTDLAAVRPVGGMTEVGTALTSLRLCRDHISDSLVSLAGPREEKLHRKHVLLELSAKMLGIDIKLPEIERPSRPHFVFGETFAVDFLVLWVAKRAGRSWAESMVRDLPDDLEDFLKDLRLDFYERVAAVSSGIEAPQAHDALCARIRATGMIPWTDDDQREARAVVEYLTCARRRRELPVT